MKPEASLLSNFQNTFPMTEDWSLKVLMKFWQKENVANEITMSQNYYFGTVLKY